MPLPKPIPPAARKSAPSSYDPGRQVNVTAAEGSATQTAKRPDVPLVGTIVQKL